MQRASILWVIRLAGVILVASSSFALVVTGDGQRSPLPVDQDDGLTDRERAAIYGGQGGVIDGQRRDIVIVDQQRPICYFGHYRTSQMTAPGWDLYGRALDWVNGFGNRAETKVWLATYNGTLDPTFSAERDGIAVHNWLLGTAGFAAENVHVDNQRSIETGNFAGYDVVLYVNTYPRDATNVLNQGKPFLTTSAGETDELGIGTGMSTMHEWRDYAHVIDNSHYVTQGHPLGEFTFAEGMWMDATEVAGTGIVLISADGGCDPCDMNCDGTINASDIEFFIDILFNGATPCDTCTGDTNGDGMVDAGDIEGFINCLFP